MLREKGLLQDEHWQLLDSQQTCLWKQPTRWVKCTGHSGLPYSLVPDFLVDGKTYQVPFVTEEPSVVAKRPALCQDYQTFRRIWDRGPQTPNDWSIALYQVDNADQAIKDVLKKRKSCWIWPTKPIHQLLLVVAVLEISGWFQREDFSFSIYLWIRRKPWEPICQHHARSSPFLSGRADYGGKSTAIRIYQTMQQIAW